MRRGQSRVGAEPGSHSAPTSAYPEGVLDGCRDALPQIEMAGTRLHAKHARSEQSRRRWRHISDDVGETNIDVLLEHPSKLVIRDLLIEVVQREATIDVKSDPPVSRGPDNCPSFRCSSAPHPKKSGAVTDSEISVHSVLSGLECAQRRLNPRDLHDATLPLGSQPSSLMPREGDPHQSDALRDSVRTGACGF